MAPAPLSRWRRSWLVVDQAVGNRRIYRIDPEGLAALRDHLDRFWERALDAYKDTVERDEEEL
jgi:DNA-binding PadR family transcriptional regulator